VKPQNILLDDHGHAKLVDFGIARASALTWAVPTTIMGSAAYLAPEQIEGSRPDPRSDVYSLGLVLYQMLSGRLPFEADSLAALASQRLVQDPRPLHSHAPEVPAPLAAALMRSLARRPADRFPSATAFSDALTRRVDDPDATVPMPVAAPSAMRRPPRRERRVAAAPARSAAAGRLWRTGLIAASLALLGLLFVAALGSDIPGIGDGDGGGSASSRVVATPTRTPSPTRTVTPTPTPTAGIVIPLLSERELRELEKALERARKELERGRGGDDD
jgi:serine/threonine-protein kinase